MPQIGFTFIKYLLHNRNESFIFMLYINFTLIIENIK